MLPFKTLIDPETLIPVVRFIHYVRSFIVSTFEEIAVPKP